MSASSFGYRASDRAGVLHEGAIQADSREMAASALAARGLLAIAIVRRRERIWFPSRLSAQDLATGLKVMATLLQAGLPVSRALAAFEGVAPPGWRPGLPTLREAVKAGRSLASAMREAPLGVPPLVLGIIEAGEAGSGLAQSVGRAAELTENSAQMRAALRSALAYPLLLAIAGAASVVVLVTVVLPRFAAILADLGQALPPATRAVLGLASFSRAAALPGAVAAILLALAWKASVATDNGRAAWHELLLRLPVLGAIRRQAAASRAALALGALLRSGVPVATALSHASRASGDAAQRLRLEAARERIIGGERLSRAIAEEGGMTDTAVRLIRAGEESGELSAMLEHAARLEGERAERTVRAAVRMVEPAMILVFGGIVAFVAAALLQAIYSIRPGA